MAVSPAPIGRRPPEIAHIVRLVAAGFLFLPWTYKDGERFENTGWHTWTDGTVDTIRYRSATDAEALRVSPAYEIEIVWKQEGTVADVVTAMLELPAPGSRGAPRLCVGAVPRGLLSVDRPITPSGVLGWALAQCGR